MDRIVKSALSSFATVARSLPFRRAPQICLPAVFPPDILGVVTLAASMRLATLDHDEAMNPNTMSIPANKSSNAFDALRMLAALAVLYSHGFALYGLGEPEPFAGKTLGALAVAAFFSISGFLVCQSWERDPHLGRYAARRALRIFPGLWVVVLLTALGVGVLFTTAPVSAYLESETPWLYIAKAGAALGSPPLLGVFENNPFPDSVNGSLWTLKYEIIMYLMLGCFGMFLPRTALRAKCTIAFLICVAASLMFAFSGKHGVPAPFVWRLGTDFYLDRIAYLGAFFFAGACAHLYIQHITLSRKLAFVSIVLLLLIENKIVVTALAWVAVPYLVLVFAYQSPELFKKTNGWDFSYGIYIYAFPIQQVYSQVGIERGWGFGFVLFASFITTVSMAALSWRYVEKPALRLKRLIPLIGKPATVNAATSA